MAERGEVSSERTDGVFVWPPRAVDPRELDAPPNESGYWKWNPRERTLAPIDELEDEGDPFADDLEEPEAGEPEARPEPRMVEARGLRWFARALERELLGRTLDPMAERVIGEFEAGQTCGRCGGVVGPYEEGDRGCPACVRVRVPWDAAAALGPWRDGLRRAILDVKFRRAEHLGVALGERLARPVAGAIESVGARSERNAGGPIVVVPVPMPASRRFDRGIDHAETIALGLARGLKRHPELRGRGVSVVPMLRAKPGPTQLDVTPAQRARNVRGRFGATKFGWAWNAGRAGGGGASTSAWIRGVLAGPVWTSAGVLARAGVIVLVDDVRTTGATMLAAGRSMAAMLRRAGLAAPGRAGRQAAKRADPRPGPAVIAAWTAVVPGKGRSRPARPEHSPTPENVRNGAVGAE
ncbi:MAG: hypothetical protein SFY95_06640 [Planctomycetota bacterium]|nr:hypothetical protein [Planctomycetota bacterium]